MHRFNNKCYNNTVLRMNLSFKVTFPRGILPRMSNKKPALKVIYPLLTGGNTCHIFFVKMISEAWLVSI